MRPATLDETRKLVARFFGARAGESVGTLKPPGEKPENCGELHVLRCNDGKESVWTESVWIPTFKERIKILFGKPLWMGVWAGGMTQPPVALHIAEDWKPIKGKKEPR